MKKFLLILAILISASFSFSQSSIEFSVAYGTTLINIEDLVDQDEVAGTIATEWGLENYGFGVQYVFPSSGKVNFGAELMYHYLYWYSVKVPYGVQPIYRDYYVASTRVTPFVRLGAENPFNMDLGLEFNSIDELALGLMASGNYYVPITDQFNFGLKLRLDLISYTVFTPVVSINVGFKYDID